MKILALSASPHANGNSAHLIDELLAGARAAGADTERLDVNLMEIRGCQGDFICKKAGRCALKDDMQIIYDKVDRADAVVFASPVYMGDVSAQLKAVLDRLFPYLDASLASRIVPPKRSAFIATQAQPDGKAFWAQLESFPKVLKVLGFGDTEVLLGTGLGGPDAAAQRPDLEAGARELGRKLAQA